MKEVKIVFYLGVFTCIVVSCYSVEIVHTGVAGE